jgi:hypothetical protein
VAPVVAVVVTSLEAAGATSVVDVAARLPLSTPRTSLPSLASATKLPATHEVLKDPLLG